MSRLVNGYAGTPAPVETDADNRPVSVDGQPVLRRLSHFRQWVGVLDGTPQADVWLVETPVGVCEVRFLCHPLDADDEVTVPPGEWLLCRWED